MNEKENKRWEFSIRLLEYGLIIDSSQYIYRSVWPPSTSQHMDLPIHYQTVVALCMMWHIFVVSNWISLNPSPNNTLMTLLL